MQNPLHGETLPLAGYPVLSTTSEDLRDMLETRLDASDKTVLVFANTNFVLQCQPIRPWLNGEEVIIVNDGIGMDIASLLQHGRRFRNNLNGTDFMPFLFKTLGRVHRIFLVGSKMGVAEKAAAVIEGQMGQQVVGCADGYSATMPGELCERINASGADIVLVALGNPDQEKWIQQNMGSLNANLFVSVGALLDFLSGGVRRAPLWVQKIRFEWLFRLCQEPQRLLRRYTVDIARFLYLCLRDPIHKRLPRAERPKRPVVS